jgi:hypothetical protein
VRLASETRLGTQAGGQCAYVIYISSCTMHTDSLQLHTKNNVRQILGFKNSPWVGDHQPRKFFEATGTTPNARAWLDEMDEFDGWYVHLNSPICITFGSSESDCRYVENNARLKAGILLDKPSGPLTHYRCAIRDYGDGGCPRKP